MLKIENTSELNWLAGLLEGEGTFQFPPPSQPSCPVIELNMTDKDTVERAGRMLGAKVRKLKPGKAHHKTPWKIQVRGKYAVEAMIKMRPLMGQRRKARIDCILLKYLLNYPPT